VIQRPFPFRRAVLLALVSSTFASGALASGGGGGGPGSARSRTDATYELGKAVFRGRAPEARGLEVCLLDEQGETPSAIAINRESMKPFRRGPSRALRTRLVECGSEPRPVSHQLDRTNLGALVHYLNQRYRLKLEG